MSVTKSCAAVEVDLYPTRPLLPMSELEKAREYWFMPDGHAMERMNQRGIGVLEVYSTLVEPETVLPSQTPDCNRYQRGDVEVVVNDVTHYVVTVADRNEGRRTTPRVPNNTPAPERTAAVTRGDRLIMPAKALQENEEDLKFVKARIKNPNLQEYRRIVIGPEIAAALMRFNLDNRKLRRARVKHYKRIIKLNAMWLTHQGMAKGNNGHYLDGQHRSQALLDLSEEEGRPFFFETWLLNGMDYRAYVAVDNGLNRTGGDVIGDPKKASLIRMLVAVLERDGVLTQGITNAELAEFYDGDPEAVDHAFDVGRSDPCREIKLTVAAAGAAYYLIARLNPSTVDAFFESLPVGDGPARALRNATMGDRKGGTRAVSYAQTAWVLKAWRNHVEGRDDKTIRWAKGEPFPTVARIDIAEEDEDA